MSVMLLNKAKLFNFYHNKQYFYLRYYHYYLSPFINDKLHGWTADHKMLYKEMKKKPCRYVDVGNNIVPNTDDSR